MSVNPYQQFMQQSVSTMTPVQLLVALYEKAEQELQKAILYIERKNYEKANASIGRAEDIICMLDGSLKMKYEIAENLAALYDYIKDRLVEANVKKDIEIIKEVLPFITELKETFTEVSKKGY